MKPEQGEWIIERGGLEYSGDGSLSHNSARVYWLGDLPPGDLPPPPTKVLIYKYDNDKKELFDNKFYYLDTTNPSIPVWKDAYDKLPADYKTYVDTETQTYRRKVAEAAAPKSNGRSNGKGSGALPSPIEAIKGPTAPPPLLTNGDPEPSDNSPPVAQIMTTVPGEVDACNKAIVGIRTRAGGKRRRTRTRSYNSSSKRRRRTYRSNHR